MAIDVYGLSRPLQTYPISAGVLLQTLYIKPRRAQSDFPIIMINSGVDAGDDGAEYRVSFSPSFFHAFPCSIGSSAHAAIPTRATKQI